MNKILLIFLFIFNIGYSQDTKYFSTNTEFDKGEIAFMFGNDVKLREQPNTESDVLSLLRIGEQIEILEKSDATMEFDGMESPWYKIKTKDKEGYVLGSLISLDRVFDKNLVYLISLKKDDSRLFLKTRVLEPNLEFKENISELSTWQFSIKASGNKGIENIKSIFEIDYLAEACGVDGGGMYLFYDGNELIKAIDYTQVSDAGLYWFMEEYTFPNDEDGVKGKIIYKSDSGETKEYDTEWTESTVTRRLLEWNGKEIFPKIDPEKAQ
ncbi:SH3 domain-containing protein [Formosa sp. PL04]|uniref:SH3 domain-containing protein n=1 Tax=Formosa sp. PL04 TaxID=3081755 RepID=UPI002980DCCF|nr:SH3 domain-containing protein [Formosa sp. PL04]MDW5290873.1 SH3 domain-containing protein [Formosa sp. PL04]